MNTTFCGPADTLFLICLVFAVLFFFMFIVSWAAASGRRAVIIHLVVFIVYTLGAVFFYHAMDSDWNYDAAVKKEAERQIKAERMDTTRRQRIFSEDVAAKKAEILRQEEWLRELSRERWEFLEREMNSADSLVVSSHQTEEE